MTTTAAVTPTAETSNSATPEWRETRPEPFLRLKDNPLARAFGRRALRPTRAWPDALIIAIVGSLMTWATTDASMSERDIAYRFALGLFALPLVLLAPISIASNVGLDRANGLLDFHRSSPTSALSNVVGYMLGNAARWIFCSAVGLPFTIVISLLAGHSIAATLVDVAMVLAYGVFYASIGAMAGTIVNASKVASAGIGIAVPIALNFGGMLGVAAGQTSEKNAIAPFFFGMFSPLVAILPNVSVAARLCGVLIVLAASGFALRVATRRFARESAIPFTRVDAFAFVVAATALHGLHHHLVPWPGHTVSRQEYEMLSFAGTLGVALGTVAIATIALMPRRSHLVAWARRAAGDPLAPAASAIADQGASIVPATLVLGLVATGIALGLEASPALLGPSTRWMIHAAGAVVLLPIISVAMSENSTLRHPRNVIGWTVLSSIVLLLPIGFAGVAAMLRNSADWSPTIASFSPLFLPFAATDADGLPVVSWIASFAAIAFFTARSMSARRALVARLRGAVRA